MKLVEHKNCTEKRINIMQVGLRLNPGQTRRVHPSMVTHPAVSPYVGKGLNIVPDNTAKTKVEPIAPVASPEPPAAPVVAEVPETPEAPKAVEETPKEEEETDGTTLRDAFVEAPGVTDDNVDAVMSVFSSFKELAAASKGDLTELGVAKSYAKKLLDYAAKQ